MQAASLEAETSCRMMACYGPSPDSSHTDPSEQCSLCAADKGHFPVPLHSAAATHTQGTAELYKAAGWSSEQSP